MWQDGLALLIVLIAALMLVRTYAPKFRFGAGRECDDAARNAALSPEAMTTHCHGCDLTGCFRGHIAAKKAQNRLPDPLIDAPGSLRRVRR